MTTNNPVTVEGKLFNKLGIDLSIKSPLPGGGSRIAVTAAFSRMHVTENGDAEILPGEDPVYVLSSNIAEEGGDAELLALSKIEAALQEYANTKGI
jgi:hypothetical protein